MKALNELKRLTTDESTKSMAEGQIVFVKVAPDVRISVYVNVAKATVVDVLQKVSRETGLCLVKMIPCFGEPPQPIVHWRRLSHCGIQEYSTIHLLVNGMMWVVFPDGEDDEKFPISVHSLDTMEAVKHTIWLQTGLVPGRQRLSSFPSWFTLSDLNIGFGSTLLVEIVPEEEEEKEYIVHLWGIRGRQWNGRGTRVEAVEPPLFERARTAGR